MWNSKNLYQFKDKILEWFYSFIILKFLQYLHEILSVFVKLDEIKSNFEILQDILSKICKITW